MDNNSQNVRMNICFGCMKPLEDGQFICQSCGHNNSHRNNPEDTLPEGSILNGKYLVGKVLGRGGFGVTYLGFELNLQIRVAIKEFFPMGMSSRSSKNYSVISSAAVEDEAFSKGCSAFLDEARTLAVINSPYVVHVRDYFKEHSTAYLIMDYVDGVTLAREMKESGGRIPPGRLFSLINPMVLEIEKLHKKNIIHRDIAPDNLIIVQDELTGDEHLVLLDFGAARSFVSSQISQKYTATVKAGFAPLEQYSQKSKQGPYTDVYALCATIYYTLTGVIPPSALERSADGAEIEPLESFGIDLPDYVVLAIMHGLVQSSESRTQTMQQLYEELTTPPDERQIRYNAAKKSMEEATTEEDYCQAEKEFAELGDYKDSTKLTSECRKKAEECQKRTLYAQAKELMAEDKLSAYKEAAKKLENVGDWQDAAQQLDYCRLKIKELSGGDKPKVKIVPIILSTLVAAGAIAFAVLKKPEPVTELDDTRVNEMQQQIDSLMVERDEAVKRAEAEEEARLESEKALQTANEALDKAQDEVDQAKAEADQAKAEADQAKAEVDQAKAEADQAKAEADRAKAEVDQAKAEADQAKSEAEKLKASQEEAELAAKAKEEEAAKANAEAEAAKIAAEEARASAEAAEKKAAETEKSAGASAKEAEEALKEAKAAAEAAEKKAAEAEAEAKARAEEADRAKEQAEKATKSAESAKAEAEAAEQRAAEATEARDAAEQKATEATKARDAAEQKATEATKAKNAAEQKATEATEAKAEAEQKAIEATEAKNAAEQRANEAAEAKEEAEQRANEAKKEKEDLEAKEQQRNREEYERAVALFKEGNYETAKAAFQRLGDYLDSPEYVAKCDEAVAEKDKAGKLRKQVPVIVSVDLDEDNNPVITWDAMEGADYYTIFRSEDDSSYTNLNINTKETSYTVKSCKEGQEYYFKIKARLTDSSYTEFSETMRIKIPRTVQAETLPPEENAMNDNEAIYAEGLALLEKGQYLDAEEIFESLGDYEDSSEKLAEARYFIGIGCETGTGVTKNERLAMSYYQLAADSGYGDAILKLGQFAYDGIGRSQNYDDAFALFEQASDLGCEEAYYFLGLCYENGTGAEKNERLALSYYQLAADAENADALNKLGECAYYGIGRSQDYKEAFSLFELASDLGSAEAFYNIGLCYENGYGVEKNEKTAMAYYMIAADEGHEAALKKIGE